MGEVSGIEWTEATWNPTRGCTRISAGCLHCYAEREAYRKAGPGGSYEGLVELRNGRPAWTGEVRVIDSHLFDPIRWRAPRRIFVDSMSDLFHENLADDAIDRIVAVILLAKRHTFQVLTKRAERMRRYLTAPRLFQRLHRAAEAIRTELGGRGVEPGGVCPLEVASWIWWGVSAETQGRAGDRIPELLACAVPCPWVSAEPLLEGVNLRHWLKPDEALRRAYGWRRPVGWVVVGGESGPNARRCDTTWIASIVDQCRTAGVPVFVKQLGAHATDAGQFLDQPLKHRKGGDLDEWPSILRVREFPRVERRISTCNGHSDCGMADAVARTVGRSEAHHCHVQDCAECFGQ